MSDSERVLSDEPQKADRRLQYGEDPFQFGDLRLPSGPGPHPVVVFIHGGYYRARYDLTHAGFLCVAFALAGFASWSLEYRRLGNPGGGWPGTFQDVLRGLDHVGTIAEQYSLDPDRTVVVGHSAGGHLALWAAAASTLPDRSISRATRSITVVPRAIPSTTPMSWCFAYHSTPRASRSG